MFTYMLDSVHFSSVSRTILRFFEKIIKPVQFDWCMYSNERAIKIKIKTEKGWMRYKAMTKMQECIRIDKGLWNSPAPFHPFHLSFFFFLLLFDRCEVYEVRFNGFHPHIHIVFVSNFMYYTYNTSIDCEPDQAFHLTLSSSKNAFIHSTQNGTYYAGV